ncbi:MAG: thiamine pyrophosphate-binding protein [Chloroflexi bacterium]|nr:thiamine pyrophosphate-binding protein [Chloroflexota bacterium]
MTSMAKYGSDYIVDILKALGIEYLAFNPGTTFRGIHESLVNYGSSHPEIVLCLHEEIAVAIAQGYGVATRKPMAVALHDLVGLQHATMAIYNAWCDRAPVLLLGGGSPLDATKRRNAPEWLHAAIVPGNLVRDFVKWDDYVINSASLTDSFMRGYRLATEQPQGPVFLCLDAVMQELPAGEAPEFSCPPDGLAASVLNPDPEVLDRAASLLVKAEMPVVLADRAGRNPGTVTSLVELAELLALPVLDLGKGLNFPATHPLDLTGDSAGLLARADVIMALDVEDLWGFLHRMESDRKKVTDCLKPGCKIIDVSLRDLATKGWVQDYQRLKVADVSLVADTAAVVPQLVKDCKKLLAGGAGPARDERRQWIAKRHAGLKKQWQQQAEGMSADDPIALPWMIRQIWPAIQHEDWVMTTGHGALAEWARRLWVMDKPHQYVASGGIGLGRDMGVAIGAALANRKQGRLVINLQPDGDLLYTPGSLWTAANMRLPVVSVIYNNRCYGNSEYHFGLVAKARGRSEETRGAGTYLDSPVVDFASVARGLGAYAEGPVNRPQDIAGAVARAVKEARKNSLPAVVDVVCRRTDRRTGFM